MGRGGRKEGFFFEKKKQKLSDSGVRAFEPAQAQINKVFFASFLFTKKKTFLSPLSTCH
jgi:hypothetical protein